MTMGPILLIAQAMAAPGASPASPPDIEIAATIRAREVRIEQEGPIRVELRADPGVSDIAVERSQPAGARSYRNLTIDARLAAWLSQDTEAQVTATTDRSTGEPPQ